MKQISDSPPVWRIVSIFHNVKCSVTNVTQTTAWCNLRESRSEVRVQFSRVYLSPSCSTSATCASQAEISPPPPNANVKAQRGTNTRSCDLPPRQRTSTWQSWKNSGWWGWGEDEAGVSSKKKWSCIKKPSITQCVYVCVCVCRFVCVCIPERLLPFIVGPHFAFSCISSHQ